MQYLLDELSKALSSTGCPATRINPPQSTNVEVGEQLCDLPEYPIEETRRDYELICPDKQCKEKRKPYSKKTNLLRPYRSRTSPLHILINYRDCKAHVSSDVTCTTKCACKAILANVDEFIRHFEECPVMQVRKAKDSKPSHEQWETIKLKDSLLERARQQLNTRVGWHEHGSRIINTEVEMQSTEAEMCMNLTKAVGHMARESSVKSLQSSMNYRRRKTRRTKHSSSALQRPLVSSTPEADTNRLCSLSFDTPTDLFLDGTANRESGTFGMINHVVSRCYRHILTNGSSHSRSDSAYSPQSPPTFSAPCLHCCNPHSYSPNPALN